MLRHCHHQDLQYPGLIRRNTKTMGKSRKWWAQALYVDILDSITHRKRKCTDKRLDWSCIMCFCRISFFTLPLLVLDDLHAHPKSCKKEDESDDGFNLWKGCHQYQNDHGCIGIGNKHAVQHCLSCSAVRDHQEEQNCRRIVYGADRTLRWLQALLRYWDWCISIGNKHAVQHCLPCSAVRYHRWPGWTELRKKCLLSR